jgi:hypothetical protein
VLGRPPRLLEVPGYLEFQSRVASLMQTIEEVKGRFA